MNGALETYTVSLIRGDRRKGPAGSLRDASTASRTFTKPSDRIGDKSIANYAQYADKHIYDVTIPGCGNGRVFAGQRREGFVVDLAEVFDLVNLNPLGPDSKFTRGNRKCAVVKRFGIGRGTRVVQ